MVSDEFITEFLCESNAIERVYAEDALDDAQTAWEYAASQTELTHEVIRGIHSRLLSDRQPSIAGEYRSVNVRVGSDRPPEPSAVEELLTGLLSEPVDSAADAISWHVSFEKIHPFADGNGRVGRIIYLWHCVEHLDTHPIMWRVDDVEGYYALFQTGEVPEYTE